MRNKNKKQKYTATISKRNHMRFIYAGLHERCQNTEKSQLCTLNCVNNKKRKRMETQQEMNVLLTFYNTVETASYGSYKTIKKLHMKNKM